MSDPPLGSTTYRYRHLPSIRIRVPQPGPRRPAFAGEDPRGGEKPPATDAPAGEEPHDKSAAPHRANAVSRRRSKKARTDEAEQLAVPPEMRSVPLELLSSEDEKRFDERLMRIEPQLQRADWRAVAEELEKEEVLPPQLAMVYAMAAREVGRTALDADRLALDAVAALLMEPAEHAAALVTAKRLLRTRPSTTVHQEITGLPALIVLVIILAVAVLGFFAGQAWAMLQP